MIPVAEVDALMESWGLGEQQQQIPTHALWVLCQVGPSVQVSDWVLQLVVSEPCPKPLPVSSV